MSGVNKVFLLGFLGRDPELRYTQAGDPVCTLSVATSRRYTNKKTSEQVEETEWHRVTVFGAMADNCARYLTKGRGVHIEGRLHTSDYVDREGITRYSTEVIARSIQFLPNAKRRSVPSDSSAEDYNPEHEYDPARSRTPKGKVRR